MPDPAPVRAGGRPDPGAVLRALGDPTRQRLLALLAGQELPVHEVVALLAAAGSPISQPAVSQHLGVLRSAGLVVGAADGTRRRYRIAPEGVVVAQRWLAGLLEPAAELEHSLDALETEVARGRRVRRSSVVPSGDVAAPPAAAG